TEHVMLAGEGALAFALQEGFPKADLLTAAARRRWSTWRRSGVDDEGRLGIEEEGHDTIGMLALDPSGNCAAACTTSGVGWKLRGRVGDSPIPGAGLFVDNAVGAAVGTGRGELIMQVCGSHLVVES
ncbi:MAG: isoaspartyl peptidase/L-asparaginase, partial [Proteobacteria bacterium]|nr:isoaspartyl peptidase/L-asparaginase [Pseudomonadota bacterium]